MSVVNFGMSFVLKGVNHPKINSKLLIDGLFQVNLPGRMFHFITKCIVVHSVAFSELYRTAGNPDNSHIIIMLFNSNYPCELHAQNEAERAIVAAILEDIVAKRNVDVGDKLRNHNITKKAWVKKKGKVMGAKRLLHLDSGRKCVVVYKSDVGDSVLPSYHIYLHSKVTIAPRKTKSLQLIGTYKNIWASFSSKAERDEWVDALQTLKEPPPSYDFSSSPLMIEPRVQYMPDAGPKKYPAPYFARGHAGPSAY